MPENLQAELLFTLCFLESKNGKKKRGEEVSMTQQKEEMPQQLLGHKLPC